MRTRNTWRVMATAFLYLLLAGPPGFGAEDEAARDFATAVIGEWTGTGVVYGNEVTLSRSWQPELQKGLPFSPTLCRYEAGEDLRLLAFLANPSTAMPYLATSAAIYDISLRGRRETQASGP